MIKFAISAYALAFLAMTLVTLAYAGPVAAAVTAAVLIAISVTAYLISGE